MTKFIRHGGAFIIIFLFAEFLSWYAGNDLFQRSVDNAFVMFYSVLFATMAQLFMFLPGMLDNTDG